MKKLLKLNVLFVLFMTLISCRENITQKKMITAPPTVAVSKTSAPTITPFPTEAPDLLLSKIAFLPNLGGSLYFWPGDNNVALEVNFDIHQILYHQLPNDCQIIVLLPADQTAACEIVVNPNRRDILIYGISSGESVNLKQIPNIYRWGISSSKRSLFYTISNSDKNELEIYKFDFATNESKLLIAIKDYTKLSFPYDMTISEKFLIAVKLDESWSKDNISFQINLGTSEMEPARIPEDIAIAESASHSNEWSPDEKLVALVGYYKSDEPAEIGYYQCRRVVLLYDPATRTVVSSVKSPDNECFWQADVGRFALWSPDGLKIAFNLGNTICIADTALSEQECNSVPNFQIEGYEVHYIAWSPDSNFIAFSGNNYNYIPKNGIQEREERLDVFSLHENEIIQVVQTDASSPWLLWNLGRFTWGE